MSTSRNTSRRRIVAAFQSSSPISSRAVAGGWVRTGPGGEISPGVGSRYRHALFRGSVSGGARNLACIQTGLRVPVTCQASLPPDAVADAFGVDAWGPVTVEEHHHLELAWYTIHPIERLYTPMRPGCREVSRSVSGDASKGSDLIVGRWQDGRLGPVRTIRPSGGCGAVVFRPKAALQSPAKVEASYAPLLKQIVTFFETGKPPVPNEVTLEIYAFMDAAQRSKEQGGKSVALR